ncbi:MAG: hypothetical protein RLZZ230_238 [Candidatus Parcubacteria bacterium]|jgi:hypothetical protein
MRLIAFIATIIIFLPLAMVDAAGYRPLVGIPGVTDPNTDFNSYIKALYIASISIAALLAVIKIVIGGVKWMLTDVVPAKGEAKKDIQGALIGLLVVLSAVLILTVINPNITNVDISLTPVPVRNYNPTVPTSEYNLLANSQVYGGVYNAFTTDDSRDRAIFIQQCKDAGRAGDSDIKGNSRCYTSNIVNPATQTITRTPSCSFSFTGFFTPSRTCTPDEITARNTECTTGGGTFTVDPLNQSHYSLCVKPK